ncbi:MAG: hypothetical protein COU46_03370 [Candidatus Niyogibacteria bacterium CG10_big_fil_rev_8_21_14_0_10_42_19]|uniref:Uncharacterized protein n=1 Tax=Candidatus Niyogibacteria bacterium CG10_big_fil_rev_8_21_14_0_10_42_19 TaxID=1974725 RepID=A0A2H0TGI3_9BACT|nr:MAG: hypothetical protein COU46_03370 [Candidatus Niyogibacteria bacterium CG10_big_fil_rev_8_21_14_0_10_42_19]
MGIFFKDKPKVNREEFKKVRQHLRYEGFHDNDIKDIEKIYHGDIEEGGPDHGIDKKELDRGIKWLKEHKSKHSLSENQIKILEEELKKKL